MSTIFVSYSRKDIGFLDFIVPQIQTIYGYASLWYDRSHEGIQGSEKWWDTITKQIRDCELFLFIMSDNSVDSYYCQEELKKAIYNHKTILPILIKNYSKNYPENLPSNLSEYMRAIHYLDFRMGYEDLSRLWGSLNRIRDRSISVANRWMLHNQFEILDLLQNLIHVDEQREYYKKEKEIIEMGYEWFYSDISQNICSPMEYGDSEEVIEILEMYRAIHTACKNDVDCSDIDSRELKFLGFDGNHETDQFSFARFVLDQGKFRESSFEDMDDLNSHMPMLPMYRAMLKAWKDSDKPHELTKPDIIRILESQEDASK